MVGGDLVPPLLAGESDFVRTALSLLPAEPWDTQTWSAWVGALQSASGRKGRDLYHPLRLALTGEEKGPELAKMLPLMGREKVARRLSLALI